MLKIILGIIIGAAIVAGAWFILGELNGANSIATTDPTPAGLRDAMVARFGACGGTPDTCMKLDVAVEKVGSTWYVIVTKSGLGDDSVSAVRYQMPLSNVGGNWVASGSAVETQRCSRGDNTTDFTTNLCP